MAIEIVDLSIKHGNFPWFFVCLPGRVKSTSMASPLRGFTEKPKKKNGGSLTRKNVKCGTCFIYLVFQEGLGLYMYIYICIYTYTCIMYIYIIIYIDMSYVYKLAQQDLSNQCNHMSLCNIEMLEPIICCI